jgi:hypothetical protein
LGALKDAMSAVDVYSTRWEMTHKPEAQAKGVPSLALQVRMGHPHCTSTGYTGSMS